MFRSSLVVVALIASLAACEAEGGEEPATPEAAVAGAQTTPVPTPTSAPAAPQADPALSTSEEGDANCGADKLGRWLNVLPTDDVKSQIAATVGRRAIRYIAPGDAVTLDFSPSRLNVELGADGRIKLFRCG